MEQQSTTSNIAAGEPAQSETNVPQPQQQIPSSENDAEISFLKSELLYVGFVGFIHNLSLLVLVLFDFIFYFGELLRLLKIRDNVFKVVCIMLGLLVAITLSVGAIVTDVFLRESTYPSNGHKQKTKMQHYLIVNTVYLGFGLIVSAVLFFTPDLHAPLYTHIRLLVSHCLRMVCMFVVFQTWTLLRQRPGLKKYGGLSIPFPSNGHNQSSTQTVPPSTQLLQQRELEMKKMEHKSTTSNVASGETAQPEINIPQQPQQQTSSIEKDMLLSFLKPELLSVGLIGLFNNISLLVILICYVIAWSIALDLVLKNTDTSRSDSYLKQPIYGLTEAKFGSVFGFLMAHLIGCLLAIGAIVMDVFLRRSATEANNPNQRFTLQRYLIFNAVCLKFGLFMSLVISFYVPLTVIGQQFQFGLIISNCLRAGCIFIVYKYWTLLRQIPGFMKFGGFPMPLRGQNQYLEQTVVGPSTQVQRI